MRGERQLGVYWWKDMLVCQERGGQNSGPNIGCVIIPDLASILPIFIFSGASWLIRNLWRSPRRSISKSILTSHGQSQAMSCSARGTATASGHSSTSSMHFPYYAVIADMSKGWVPSLRHYYVISSQRKCMGYW